MIQYASIDGRKKPEDVWQGDRFQQMTSSSSISARCFIT
jgi:hypothetical protein